MKIVKVLQKHCIDLKDSFSDERIAVKFCACSLEHDQDIILWTKCTIS